MTRARGGWTRTATALATVALGAAGCDAPPIDSVQTGFRGTGMVHVADRGELAEKVREAAAGIPDVVVPDESVQEGPTQEWENVQVLDYLTTAEFNLTMTAVTEWVVGEDPSGCNYCHVVGEDGQAILGSDDIYTKRVSRWMFEMVQDINENWSEHVGDKGVTCYTCHAAQPVPGGTWFLTDEYQPLRHYLDRDDIRVISQEALSGQSDNRSSIKQTENTYALMIHMSNAMGVNCTFCHNSPRWQDWEESTPQRVTALRGIRMVREINNEWILPIADELPEDRLGPRGDAPKVGCTTCHKGAYIPLYGAMDASEWRALQAPPADAPAPAAADPAADVDAAQPAAVPDDAGTSESPTPPEGDGSTR